VNILLLGPRRERLVTFLASLGNDVNSTEEKIGPTSDIVQWAEYLISYGYRHILKKEVLDRFPQKAINLHISYLPWNRGADPNLWSFLEDSPKGVTIHYLDTGIDTGAILAQAAAPSTPDDTLRTMYERLSCAVEELFVQRWPDICSGRVKATPQSQGGSFHRLSDRRPYESLLHRGWDTPVRDLIGKAFVARPE
jgi:methionyl-tRNA formyltransferase